MHINGINFHEIADIEVFVDSNLDLSITIRVFAPGQVNDEGFLLGV